MSDLKTRIFSAFETPTKNKVLTLEDIQVHEEPSQYNGLVARAGKSVINLVLKYVWTPLLKIWRLLRRYTNLSFWIFASIFIGIMIGYFQPEFGQEIAPLGTAFIRMIKIIVVPLIFSTLVVGIAGHSEDVSVVGKLAIKSLVYFFFVTTCCLGIGMVLVNLIKPGVGVQLPLESDEAANTLAENSSKITWDSQLFVIVPQNFFVAASNDSILGVVFCAAMFACATIQADRKSRNFMLQICDSLSQIIFKMVGLIMNYAPIGIGAALAATVGKNGIEVLANLGKLIGTVYAALAVFVVILVIPIMLVCRIPIIPFVRVIGQAWLIAFSSASSESVLPMVMDRMRAFGCPNSLVAFVIPCGYSFNLDGAAVYLSVASIFCAQAAGMNLHVSQQLSILGTLVISSKGVAAVPRAALVVLAGTAAQYGLPLSAVTMIMGVDAILDMGRTSINVLGNCLACCVMARIEGRFRGKEWKEEEEERRRIRYLEQQKNLSQNGTPAESELSYVPKEYITDEYSQDPEKAITTHSGNAADTQQKH